MANYFEDNAFFAGPFFEIPFYQDNAYFQGEYFGTAFNPPPLVATTEAKTTKTTKKRKPKVKKDT